MLAVVACSGDTQASNGAPRTVPARGPDQIVLRIPRAGGTARAYLFPRLDSVVWRAARAPGVTRVLAFDAEAGLIAFLDDKGLPRRADLRLAEIRLASRTRFAAIASGNGTDIYGVNAKGNVIRMTPSGDWTFEPPSPATAVFPQPNGSLLIAATGRTSTELWLIRAPEEEILKTNTLPVAARGIKAQAGDRLYFAVDSGLAGVTVRDLASVKNVRLSESIVAVSPTPSGDRLYIAEQGLNRISVVDRYSESISGTVQLPGPASELRMDPLGQRILARPADGQDSAWVIAIATGRVAGTIGSRWTHDLPAFAPSSSIATARGNDVIFVDAMTLENTRTVTGGARDFWYFFSWNGFRPRSAGLDQPVTFRAPDSLPASDSLKTPVDSGAPAPPLLDAKPSMIEPPASYAPVPERKGYFASFAAVLTPQKANEIAAGITINGMRARVVPSQSGATTLHRVVVGPYASREEADRAGRESGRQFWVFEASP